MKRLAILFLAGLFSSLLLLAGCSNTCSTCGRAEEACCGESTTTTTTGGTVQRAEPPRNEQPAGNRP